MDEDGRPEGVESFTVPTDAAEDPEGERPEGVESFIVPTEAANEQEGSGSVSENSEEPVAEEVPATTEVSENETVSEDETVSENGTVSGDETENKPETMIFSVQLPASPEGRSSFDFILDPDGLIEKTGAKHYGGREFQKGAHLFFMNTADPGSFSDTSDRKTIINRSNVPVKVEVKARFTSDSASENGIIRVCEDPAFPDIDQPAVAFSLKDGEDNKTAMNVEGEISCEAVLEEDSEFSFSITGAANANADWSGVTDGAKLDVSWTVRPVETEEDTKAEEEAEDKTKEEPEESASDNEALETVSENEPGDEDPDKTPSLSGSEGGRGFFEGIVDTGPYSVIMPTGHEDMYSFIMDPQRLIEATSAVAYPGKTFEKGQTLFFKNTDKDAKYDLSSKSDRLSIVNNGAKPLKVTVSVSVVSKEEFKLSQEENFAGYEDSHLYISLVSGNGQRFDNVSYSDTGVTVEAVIEPADAEAFDIDWSEERGYFRVPASEDEASEIALPEFDFRITGATNEKAIWRELKKSKVNLNVIWSIEETE